MEEKLVGVTEIAGLLGVAVNTAWRWTGRGDFPKPAATLSAGRVWRQEDIDAWAATTLPLPEGRPPKADA